MGRHRPACAELPGHELFQYLDDDGARHSVGSSDVNDSLREAAGAAFTAKDYRTWAGSVQALALLRRVPHQGITHARKQIVETVRIVAEILCNTPAVCRRCYIHPVVLETFEGGMLAAPEVRRTPRGLRADEAAFAAYSRLPGAGATAPARRDTLDSTRIALDEEPLAAAALDPARLATASAPRRAGLRIAIAGRRCALARRHLRGSAVATEDLPGGQTVFGGPSANLVDDRFEFGESGRLDTCHQFVGLSLQFAIT